jgi:CubicO group peptidase (beta-lactamase class C family)
MKNLFLLFLALLTFGVGSAQKKSKAPLEQELVQFDKLITDGLAKYNVPGAAVAVVYKNEVIFAKGFGVRNTQTNEPITANSLFAIASNSKAFTSAALAICVDRGLVKWDDKVSELLPYFKLYDPWVTEHLTVRDLLSHRQGFETFAGDLIWYGTTHSREEVVKRWRYVEPSYEFRTTYGYSNIAFLAAGLVVEKVSGKTWDEFVKSEILLPLGMTRTNTSIRDFKAGDDIASPHNTVKGKNIPIDYVNWDNIGPAGSINSCVNELAHWMRLQLNAGTWNNKEYWNAKRTYEMWEYNIVKPVSAWQREHMPTRLVNGYGLGWELMDYAGHKVVSHGGGYDGMISKTVLVPDMNLGFVILTNSNNSLPSALGFAGLDIFLKPAHQEDFLALFAPPAEEEEKVEGVAHKLTQEVVSNVSGTYHSDMYGEVVVKQVGESLTIDFLPTALFKGKLSWLGEGLFELSWSTQMMLPSGTALFVYNAKGEVEELKIVVENPDFDFSELKLKKVLGN